MRNIKLTIEYDGTGYCGWQIQRAKPTIQGKIVAAIRSVTGERVTVRGAGRTDSGVHAAGQVANFRTASRIRVDRFPHALNANLPEDISVLSAEDVSADFHAQYTPHVKTYCYTIYCHPLRPALRRHFVHHVRVPLDVGAMSRAAKYLVGEHDFRAFCTESAGKENTVRVIERCEVEWVGEIIRIVVSGQGFLYNMVRTIAGTLAEVGRGGMEPQAIPAILHSLDRHRAGPNLPASGLTLCGIAYRTATVSP